MTKTNDSDGTLKVIIDFESESYQFNKSGFLKVANDNIAKVKDFLNTLSNQAISYLANNSKLDDVITKLEALKTIIQADSSYSALNRAQKALIIKDSISISKDSTRTPKVMITFKDGTYKILKVISKPSKKDTNRLSIIAIICIGFVSIFGIGIIAFLIFYLARRNKK